MMRFLEKHIAQQQTQGRRDYQQDDCGANIHIDESNQHILLVLADGMGGEKAGDQASHIAIHAFEEAYSNAQHEGDIDKRLHHALMQANAALKAAIQQNNQLKGMGTTLVALVIYQGYAYWISVGDSILWLYRQGKLQRLNDDHSYGGILDKLVEQGKIPPEQAENADNRNMLTSALTGKNIDKISTNSKKFPVKTGDYFLLASDGVLTLTENEIAQTFHHSHPETIGQYLIQAIEAKENPDQDNATVQIVQCPHFIAWKNIIFLTFVLICSSWLWVFYLNNMEDSNLIEYWFPIDIEIIVPEIKQPESELKTENLQHKPTPEQQNSDINQIADDQ